MKDAKGHGSNTYNAAAAAITPAHQQGVAQATARTAEEYLQSGGKLPTEAQNAEFESTRGAWITAWGTPTTDHGKQAVARMQDELSRSRANYAKFGSEEKPTAYTIKLRSTK